MTVTDKKPRLFRRIFRHRDASGDVSSTTERLDRIEISKESDNTSKESAASPNSGKVEDKSTSLWGEVYSGFISTTTPDLRAIITLLRDESNAPKSTVPRHQSVCVCVCVIPTRRSSSPEAAYIHRTP